MQQYKNVNIKFIELQSQLGDLPTVLLGLGEEDFKTKCYIPNMEEAF